MVKIRIPTPLRPLAAGKDEIEVDGATVAEALVQLNTQHPGLRNRICEPNGELRRFINLYINHEDARSREGIQTALEPGDVISIVPAIAGGLKQ